MDVVPEPRESNDIGTAPIKYSQGNAEGSAGPMDGCAITNGSDQKFSEQSVINSTDNLEGNDKEQRAFEQHQSTGNFPGKTFCGPPPIRGRGVAGNVGVPDPAWQNPNRDSGIPQNPALTGPPPIELWVEAKTEDGKSYFYHAVTRETTWTKPEGPNVKVMSQMEIEDMNKKQQSSSITESAVISHGNISTTVGTEANNTSMETTTPVNAEAVQQKEQQPPPNVLTQQPPPNTQQQQMQQPPPGLVPPVVPQQQAPPGVHQHQPPPFFPPGMHPPNFSQPPFGMPPPGFGGGYPTPGAPWGMPWNPQHMHAAAAQQQEKPAKNLIIKPGVIDPAVIARAAEWSEHRAPDGRPYYYHAGRNESVWEKPQAIRDMEAARMAAHSGATPQQATASAVPQPVPHMVPNALMHMPPASAGPARFDPSLAYNAAAAAAAAAAATAAATTKATDTAKAAQAVAQEKESKKAAEEKRKKEEEQKKAASKPVDKSRPISSTPIAGTPWCVVWTGDGRVFFYNPSSRTSVWERPEELTDREDVDKAITNPPEQLKNVSAVQEKPVPVQIVKAMVQAAEAEEDEDDEIIKIRTESESSVEEIPTKKPKLSIKQSKKSDANEAAVEAEVRAAKERALVPLETRVKQFKEMLREKDVSAFSTWEKELHKIVFDPRYLLLTSKERKQVFERYVKDRAEEERKEKRNKMRQKRDDFRKLMEEAKLHGKSTFSDFCQRYGKEDRYKAIEKVRERESLFNEYIVDVRRREKEEKIQKKEQIRKDFIEMLRERSDVDRHTRWHEIKKKFETDSRYRAVENSMYREEYFLDYIRIVRDEKRKIKEQKDREREREREKEREQRERERRSDRKSDRKDRDRGRDRSRDKDRGDKDQKDKDREKEKEKEKEKDKDKGKDKEKDKEKTKNDKAVENTPKDEDMDSASEDDESERLQKERDRQLRAEQSIREREKEVQRTLAGHLRDRDKEREHHKRDEAVRHFTALLTDLVRNPDLSWKEVKRQLRKDHRWEQIELLVRDEREKIFNDHINALMKKKREKFREMLEEIPTLELTSSWKDIKKLIKEDPRYLKYNSSEKCEREFRDYIRDKTVNAKSALRELLQECKLVTHKSSEMVKENPNHLKEIEDILKNDKRYLTLNHIPEERTKIVVSYLEELHKRGPPPPPTASESTRRNK